MSKTKLIIIAVVAAVIIASGAGAAYVLIDKDEVQVSGVEVVDATGRTVHIKSSERIACASAPIPSILCGLGLSSKIVAVSTDANNYTEASSIMGIPDDDFPNVVNEGLSNGTIKPLGKMYHMSAESIVNSGAAPDLVIFTYYGFDSKTGDRLTDLGITYIVTFDMASTDVIYDNIELISRALQVEEKGQQLINNIKSVVGKITEWCKNTVNNKLSGVKFNVVIMMTSTYVAGEKYLTGTYPSMLSANNAFSDLEVKYTQITKESLAAKNPDVIIYTTLGMGDGITDPSAYIESLKSDPILKDVSAMKNNRVYCTADQARTAMSQQDQSIVWGFAIAAMFMYGDYLSFDIPTTVNKDNYVSLTQKFWNEINV